MKKKLLLVVVLAIAVTQLWAQRGFSTTDETIEDRMFRIPLIGEKAPAFNAESTTGKINFPADYGRNWKMLFSHPQDFTPVCSTEILELAHLQEEFDKLGVKILVISTDPLEVHNLWREALEAISVNNRETVKINFPLVDDENIAISKKYGMIHATTNSTKSVRGVFIIDPDNVIQSIYFYPMNVGRNTDELLRTVSALQTVYASKGDVMTPVNWTAGNDILLTIPPEGAANNPTALSKEYYSPAWFLWYKKQKP
jgi:peroxiredoxin (alkyl hydroperoxide reductase subunit C)